MVLISHRGNIFGKNIDSENDPSYIDEALHSGYDVEIDVWHMNSKLYLGHNEPLYEVDLQWFKNRKDSLWIHCKNVNSLLYFNSIGYIHDFNYFWHEEDTVTLTSKNYIWAYPGKQPIPHSIAVLPEMYDDGVEQCYGICSDYIKTYENS